jgi:hypothetical protein
MSNAEAIIQCFRRFDKKADGTIGKEDFSAVLQKLDAGFWVGPQVDLLLEASGGLKTEGAINYETLVRWLGKLDAKGQPACQAAIDGDVAAIRGLLNGPGGKSALSCTGFVKQDGSVLGISRIAPCTFQLLALSDVPGLLPASALHYAAFAGNADVVRILLEEGGMDKSDEGEHHFTPSDIAGGHRLWKDGGHVEDATGDTAALLADEPPPMDLSRAVSRKLKES